MSSPPPSYHDHLLHSTTAIVAIAITTVIPMGIITAATTTALPQLLPIYHDFITTATTTMHLITSVTFCGCRHHRRHLHHDSQLYHHYHHPITCAACTLTPPPPQDHPPSLFHPIIIITTKDTTFTTTILPKATAWHFRHVYDHFIMVTVNILNNEN